MCSFCWNFSERQILWSLCSVDFHTFTLHLPIQTLHSVAPELHVFVSSFDNCQNFSKTSTPQCNTQQSKDENELWEVRRLPRHLNHHVQICTCMFYTTGMCSFSWIFDNFPVNSKKLAIQVPEKCELKNWFCNFTFISLVLFLYVSPIYNIVMVICLNQQQNTK